ncbi:pyruvate, water dikinase regulatory protein [Microbacterium deminutum]|uniref:Putative phosphoenolpyruvate synthase regulatory protein n=1 Tax=Microbacterium deminutum TaxID=344164 RepID=A0ABP5BI97_9MICO
MPGESPEAERGSTPARGRLAYFVSDSTGITAETLGNALLINFPAISFETYSFPFVDTVDEAELVVREMDGAADVGEPPLMFTTVKVPAVRAVLARARAVTVDLLSGHLGLLEEALGTTASEQLGQYHGVGDVERYFGRMRAVEYALEHDDGQSMRGLDAADVIIVAPSRCGKTPTTMYLALQYGLRVANYPLIDDDFEREALPSPIAPYLKRCFGLTTNPLRLSQVRHERRPSSRYASLEQCTYELRRAEELYARFGIPYMNSATKSVEEMSVVILQTIRDRDTTHRDKRKRTHEGVPGEGARI